MTHNSNCIFACTNALYCLCNHTTKPKHDPDAHRRHLGWRDGKSVWEDEEPKATASYDGHTLTSKVEGTDDPATVRALAALAAKLAKALFAENLFDFVVDRHDLINAWRTGRIGTHKLVCELNQKLAEYTDVADLSGDGDIDTSELVGAPLVFETHHPDDPDGSFAVQYYSDGAIGLLVYNFDSKRGTRVVLDRNEVDALVAYLRPNTTGAAKDDHVTRAEFDDLLARVSKMDDNWTPETALTDRIKALEDFAASFAKSIRVEDNDRLCLPYHLPYRIAYLLDEVDELKAELAALRGGDAK